MHRQMKRACLTSLAIVSQALVAGTTLGQDFNARTELGPREQGKINRMMSEMMRSSTSSGEREQTGINPDAAYWSDMGDISRPPEVHSAPSVTKNCDQRIGTAVVDRNSITPVDLVVSADTIINNCVSR